MEQIQVCKSIGHTLNYCFMALDTHSLLVCKIDSGLQVYRPYFEQLIHGSDTRCHILWN